MIVCFLSSQCALFFQANFSQVQQQWLIYTKMKKCSGEFLLGVFYPLKGLLYHCNVSIEWLTDWLWLLIMRLFVYCFIWKNLVFYCMKKRGNKMGKRGKATYLNNFTFIFKPLNIINFSSTRCWFTNNCCITTTTCINIMKF